MGLKTRVALITDQRSRHAEEALIGEEVDKARTSGGLESFFRGGERGRNGDPDAKRLWLPSRLVPVVVP